jgi:hypothetical protein
VVNNIDQVSNLWPKTRNGGKLCFGQNVLILATMLYGQMLVKPPINSRLVDENFNFFLGYHLYKINRETSPFESEGSYVQEAGQFNRDDFYTLYSSFRHRHVKPQNFIKIVNLVELTEQKWLDHVATVINTLNTLDDYEKKNLLRFSQPNLPIIEKFRLESQNIIMTSSENLIIDDWLKSLKGALTSTIVCTKCLTGLKNDQVI